MKINVKNKNEADIKKRSKKIQPQLTQVSDKITNNNGLVQPMSPDKARKRFSATPTKVHSTENNKLGLVKNNRLFENWLFNCQLIGN